MQSKSFLSRGTSILLESGRTAGNGADATSEASLDPSVRPVAVVRRVAGHLILIVAFAIAFFILQKLTFLLRFPPYERTTLWVPGALTFSALLISPISGWWRFYIGLCIASYAAYYGDPEIPGPVALLSAQFHFAAVAIGAWGILRLTHRDPFATVPSMLVFVLAAGLVIPLATSAPADLTRWMRGLSDVWPTAIRSVLCISLGMLIGTPAITSALAGGRQWLRRAKMRELLEGTALAISLLAVGLWVFTTSADSKAIPALVYAPIPFLLWATLRFEIAGASWALLAIAYLSTWNAINGRGPFVGGSRDDHVLQLQLFLMAVALPLLFMAVVVGERRRAHALLIHETDERRKVEEGLRHASRLAVLSEFTASIAHEINQPLGAILCNAEAAELLLQKPTPPMDEIRRIMTDIRNDDLRASEVIRSLRALLKHGEVERQPVSIHRVVMEVIAILRTEAERRGIELHTELTQVGPIVLGDCVHLQQVLLNLIINAMEAMQGIPNERRVSVCASQQDNEVVVSVTDRGPGIPSEQIPRLFDRFFSTKPEGMGMGLAISRSLIEQHGGRIWVENASDRGAIFRFSIPLDKANTKTAMEANTQWNSESAQ
jgi:signal transduction histidine kinase